MLKHHLDMLMVKCHLEEKCIVTVYQCKEKGKSHEMWQSQWPDSCFCSAQCMKAQAMCVNSLFVEDWCDIQHNWHSDSSYQSNLLSMYKYSKVDRKHKWIQSEVAFEITTTVKTSSGLLMASIPNHSCLVTKQSWRCS